MNRYVRIALLAAIAAASAAGDDVVFHKSAIFDSRGKEHKVDLVLRGEKQGDGCAREDNDRRVHPFLARLIRWLMATPTATV